MSQDSIIVEPSQASTPPVVETKAPVKLEEIKLPDDPNLDATYRGKSAAELIEMHKNAQSRIGAQGQELGVWRSLAADLSKTAGRQAIPTESQETTLKITSDELLSNPVEAISKVVSRSVESALKPIRETRELDRQEDELQALNRDFPNYTQIGNDPAFNAWVNGAKGRAADGAAVAKGDLSAARRLLEAWTDRQELAKGANRTTTTDDGKPQGVTGARTAVTETGGGRAAATGEILNRQEIVDMIIKNPALYDSDAFQQKLMLAAKENRIR
jgi:hypothetical protein